MKYLQPKRMTRLSVASPIQAVIAIACFVVLVGCGEPTGPRTLCCESKPVAEQTVTGLAVLAVELHDAADVFVQGVTDTPVRGQAELAVDRLADQLLAGKVASSRAALAQARSLLDKLDEPQSIELAAVRLALDYTERRMNEILNSGAHDG